MTYLLPSSTVPIPGGLTLTQFIQSVLAGISGIPGNLVRPKWQMSPPKQPDIMTDWIAFGIEFKAPDANAWTNMNADESYNSQRHQDLKIHSAYYGPLAMEYANIVTDGFQIPTNLEALFLANMGFVSTETMMHVPDLLNERWVDRVEMVINLRREIQRIYQVPFLVSAKGTLHTGKSNGSWQAPADTQ